MTDSGHSGVHEILENHDAFEEIGDGFSLETTVFDATVTVGENGEQCAVDVTVPTIDAATVDDVGPTVSTDWFETFERRVRDAPGATRASVELDDFEATEGDETVTVRYLFTWHDASSSADIAKTFAEFVEGTYVEGVIPGYEYTPPVSDLLSQASQGGSGGTPL